MKRDLVCAAALSAFLACVWCFAYGRTTLEAWRTPVHYGGDTLAFLAYLKAARDGHVVPVAETFVSDLNAPYEANWNDYPLPQKAFFWAAGRMARLLGLFPAANLLLLLAHLGAAVAFYGVARYLRCRTAWAGAFAVAFAASPFIWYRGLSHLALSLYWHIPLDVLVVGWCFRRHGLRLRSRQFVFALVVTLATALFNVYYAAMFVQLLVLSALAQVARRAFARAAAPLLLAAVLVGLFALESLGTLLYPVAHGKNLDAVHRTYADLERYALKPIELALPPPGYGLLRYGDLARGYWDNARGESSSYLGLAALAGLGCVVGGPVVALVRRRRVFIPPVLGAAAWILAYSVAGGVNGVVGSVGVMLFRGTNRYSIWLMALALLFLAGRLSRSAWARRMPAPVAPALLALFALADQTPGLLFQPADAAAQGLAVEKDRLFAEQIEASLPGRPMVFMLPVHDFPESGPVRQMGDYEQFRPYLFTSRVRYSYGTDKGRPREEWQKQVEALSPAKMVDRLEGYGFSALVVDRRAYADSGRSLLSGVLEAGRTITFDEPGGGRALVRLLPRAPALLPESAPRLGAGWYGRPQSEGSWAREREADWIVVNGGSVDETVVLSFELTVAKSRKVFLSQGGRVVAAFEPNPSVSVAGLRVVVPPGESHLVLSTDRPPDLVEMGNRLRAATYAVKDLEMMEE
jgi:hypothetical protein